MAFRTNRNKTRKIIILNSQSLKATIWVCIVAERVEFAAAEPPQMLTTLHSRTAPHQRFRQQHKETTRSVRFCICLNNKITKLLYTPTLARIMNKLILSYSSRNCSNKLNKYSNMQLLSLCLQITRSL